MWRRAGIVAVPVLCGAVLATRVHTGFERARTRLITEAVTATEPSLSVPLPDLSPLTGNLAALVVRVRAGDEPVAIRVIFNGATVGTVLVPASEGRRADFALNLTRPGQAPPDLTFAGDRAGWQVTYLEIANVHGFSEGLLRFVIVPRGYEWCARPAPWMAAALVALLMALGTRVFTPSGPWWRRAWRVAAAVVTLLFAVMLLVSRVTPFLVLMAWDSFALAVAVLYAPALVWVTREQLLPSLASLGRHAMAPARLERLRQQARYSPYLGVAALVLWGVSTHYDADTGFTRLIVFGSDFGRRAVPALADIPHVADTGSGYDGQFYAQLAFDPLMLQPDTAGAIDNPGYRARRLLVPAMAHMLGFGYPPLIIQVYALLNVASWLLLAWLLAQRLPPGTPTQVAAWLGCMLSHGLLMSIRAALTDGPSLLLLVVAASLAEAGRPLASAASLGLSGLSREATVLGALGLPLPAWRWHDVRVWAVRVAVAVLPVVTWVGILAARGFAADSGARNFAPPLAAYWWKWSDTLARMTAADPDPYAWYSLFALIGLSTQALVLAWLAPAHRHEFWWRTGMAFAVLMLVLGPSVWEGHPGAVTRALLPMTFAFNLLLPHGRAFWPLWALGNLSLSHSLEDLGVSLPWT